MLIDTHSHIYYEKYNDDLDEVIHRAKNKGVKKIICVGTDLESSIQSLEISNKYRDVYCSIGFHPHESSLAKKDYLYKLEEMSKEDKVVAIGETGLDYYYNYSDQDIQKKIFIEQIELANSLELPVVIHNRNSDDDLYEILKKYRPNGVIHCFSSDINYATKILKIGVLLSFTGIITFKNSTLDDVIKKIDLSKIMVETDSPYLTPIPYRGKRNEPSYVELVAKKIAEIKNISLEEVAHHTTQNALNLFHKIR
tara:strand:- start:137 stop:895 length:759 start_codon:yes stop_codon:yes gene_type:complete